MTRGNQRDSNRERSEKQKAKSGKDKLPDATKRQVRDADIMREKQKAAQDKQKADEEKAQK